MTQADHRAFSLESAATLTGLSERQLRDWTRDGFFCPHYWTAENASDPFRPIFYSFRDLVGLRTIALLRKEHKIPLQRIRKFGVWLNARYETPWSSLKFWISGKELYFDCPDTGASISSAPAGQTIAPQVIKLDRIAEDVDKKVTDLRRRRKDKIGHVANSKGIMGSVPTVAGTRIPTSAIWEFHEAGSSIPEIQKSYPDLTEEDIKAAIRHEENNQKQNNQKQRKAS